MDKDFETEVLTRLTRLETKVDDYNGLKTKVEESRAMTYSNERRISELEKKISWLTKTIAGAIICGIIAIGMLFLQKGLGIK